MRNVVLAVAPPRFQFLLVPLSATDVDQEKACRQKIPLLEPRVFERDPEMLETYSTHPGFAVSCLSAVVVPDAEAN